LRARRRILEETGLGGGGDENLQRAVRDNCQHLGFKTGEFEAEG
jgi:hypothetical protein